MCWCFFYFCVEGVVEYLFLGIEFEGEYDVVVVEVDEVVVFVVLVDLSDVEYLC